MGHRIRPQILIGMMLLGGIAFYSIYHQMTDIATGCITLLGALSMKVLESE
jgi:hypothetical protein